MIYNYVKCESVIAKIMADLDSTEVRQRTTDIREWIFEAVEKIGAPMQYIQRESGSDGVPLLKIQDYQVPLPDDLQYLDGVAYCESPKGHWVPMRTSTGIFKSKKHTPNVPELKITHDPNNLAIDEPVVVGPEPHGPMMNKLPTSQHQLHLAKYSGKMKQYQPNEDPQYFIKPGWIVTNRRNGFIKLAYKAIATDERGYPLIPDSTSYQEAVYWYVVMKLSFPKFIRGTLSGRSNKYGAKYSQNAYTYIQQQWNFYRNQAYAEAMMPTADDMQNIKNEWNRLIPEMDEDESFFKHLGDDQQFYTDYYNGY